MAERRMFAKTIIDSDAFLEMPATAQMLYFHLAMRADDDGFINNPKRIMRMIGSGEDDLKLLILKKFIIPFESGVVVIKHWKIHNYIRKDTYNETKYKQEKATLELDENSAYTQSFLCSSRTCDTSVDGSLTQDRIGKDRIGKDRIDKNNLEEITEDSCSSIEKDLDVFKHFEKCGFIVNAMLMEQISSDIEVYSKQWLIDAATEAMNRGKINNYKYVLGILQNWLSKGRSESDGSSRITSNNNREKSDEWVGL